MFIIRDMLAGMAELFGQTGQLQNRADLRLWFLFEILSVDGAQIVRARLGDDLNGFEAFIHVWLFF